MVKILLIKPEREKEGVPSLILNLHEIIKDLGKKYMSVFLNKEGISFEPECFYSIEGRSPISLGLLSIGSFLLERGFTKKEIKYSHISQNELEKKSKLFKKFDIFGITSTTPDVPLVLQIAKKIKEINESSLVVCGGPHATFEYRTFLSSPFIDLVVRGEGEKTFEEIVKCYESGNLLPRKIKGLVFRSKSGRPKLTPQREFLSPSEIPKIKFLDFFNRKDANKYLFYTMTSRGCWYNCLFCVESKFWKHPRIKRSEYIKEEIEEIRYLTKKKFIHFADSIFPVNCNHLDIISETLKETDMILSFNVHETFFLNNREVFRKLKMLSPFEAYIGIESCSDKILERNRKPFRFKEIQILCKKLKRNNIPLRRAYIIVGLPGEDKNTFEETYKGIESLLSKNLLFDIIPRIFVPYPGLEPYKFPSRFNIQKIDTQWGKYARWYFPPPFSYSYLSNLELFEFLVRLYLLQIRHMCRTINDEEILSKFNLSTKFP